MALVPGEYATEVVKGRVHPTVKRRWEDEYRRAVLERRVTTLNEFIDVLLEGVEKNRANRPSFLR